MRHIFQGVVTFVVPLSLLIWPMAAMPQQVTPPDPSTCNGKWPNARPPDYILGEIPEATSGGGGPGVRALGSFSAHYKKSLPDSVRYLQQSATARLRFVPFLMHEAYALVKTDADPAGMNADDRCFLQNFADYASTALFREARSNYIQLCQYLLATDCPISNKLTLQGIASTDPLNFTPPADAANRIRPFLRTLADPFLTKDQLNVIDEILNADAKSAESFVRDDLDALTSNLATLRSSAVVADQPTPGPQNTSGTGTLTASGASPAVIGAAVGASVAGSAAAAYGAVRAMQWLRAAKTKQMAAALRQEESAVQLARLQEKNAFTPGQKPPPTNQSALLQDAPPDSGGKPTEQPNPNCLERDITGNMRRDIPACLPEPEAAEVSTESLDADEALGSGVIDAIGSEAPAAEAVSAEISAAVAAGEGATVAAGVEAGIEAGAAVAASILAAPELAVVGAVAGLGYLIYHFYEKTVSPRDLERSVDEGLPTDADIVSMLHDAAQAPVPFTAHRTGELYTALHKHTVTRMLFKLLVLDVAARAETPKPLVLRPLDADSPLYTQSLLVHLLEGLPEGPTGAGKFQFTYSIPGIGAGTLPRTHGVGFTGGPSYPVSENIVISQENKGPDFFAVDPWFNGTDMLLSLTDGGNDRIGAALYMFNRERNALSRSWKSVNLASPKVQGVNMPNPKVTGLAATIAVLAADVDGIPGTDIVQITRDDQHVGYVNVYSPSEVTGRLKDGRDHGCDVNHHRCTGYVLSSFSPIPSFTQGAAEGFVGSMCEGKPMSDRNVSGCTSIFWDNPPHAIATDMDADGIAEILLLKQDTIPDTEVRSLTATVLKKRSRFGPFEVVGEIQSQQRSVGTQYVMTTDPLNDGNNVVIVSSEAPGVDTLNLQYFSLAKTPLESPIGQLRFTSIPPLKIFETIPLSLPISWGTGSIWFPFPKEGDKFFTNTNPPLKHPYRSYIARLYFPDPTEPQLFLQGVTFAKSPTGDLIIKDNFLENLSQDVVRGKGVKTGGVTDAAAIRVTTETNRWGGRQLLDVMLPKGEDGTGWRWIGIAPPDGSTGGPRPYDSSGFIAPDGSMVKDAAARYLGSLRMRVVSTDEFHLPPLAE